MLSERPALRPHRGEKARGILGEGAGIVDPAPALARAAGGLGFLDELDETRDRARLDSSVAPAVQPAHGVPGGELQSHRDPRQTKPPPSTARGAESPPKLVQAGKNAGGGLEAPGRRFEAQGGSEEAGAGGPPKRRSHLPRLEHPGKLRLDAFGRDIGKPRSHGEAGASRPAVGTQAERGVEPRRSKSPQRIIVEVRLSQEAKTAVREIGCPAEWVDPAPGLEVDGDGVDREVASAEILFDRGAFELGEVELQGPGHSENARGGFRDRNRRTETASRELPGKLFGAFRDGNVHVDRPPAEQTVPQSSANHPGSHPSGSSESGERRDGSMPAQ